MSLFVLQDIYRALARFAPFVHLKPIFQDQLARIEELEEFKKNTKAKLIEVDSALHSFEKRLTVLEDLIEEMPEPTTQTINITNNCCGDTGGVDNPKIPNVTTASPYRTFKEFGIVSDPALDQTALIQQAFDTQEEVRPGPGQFAFTQLVFKQGLSVVGSGTSGDGFIENTHFIQLDGQNTSAFVSDPSLLPQQWLHHVQLRNFRLSKQVGSVDTLGSGIDMKSRTGEHFRIDEVLVERFPEHGIALRHGTTPMHLSNIHVFHNGVYGLYLAADSTLQDIFYACKVSLLSGDANGLALVGINGSGHTHDYMIFDTVKSEQGVVGKQKYVFDIRNTNPLFLEVHGVSALGTTGDHPTAVFRMENAKSTRLQVYSPRASTLPGNEVLLIEDITTGVNVPSSTNRFALGYQGFIGVIFDQDVVTGTYASQLRLGNIVDDGQGNKQFEIFNQAGVSQGFVTLTP